MKRFSLPLNLPNFITLSAVLHVVTFAAVLWSSKGEESSPLPLGVEVQYGESFEATGVTTQKKTVRAAVKPVVTEDDGDAPAIEHKKEKPAPQPVVAASTEKFGNPDGVSEKGALTGRLGVANGQEVSAEERYIYELLKLLEKSQHDRYPTMAKKLKQTGTVKVKFTLAKDGSLIASEVIEKAPYETLNRAALEALKSIHGRKPFPPEIHRVSWEIITPIEYILN
ncbi:transport protein TonB [compost metagenome]